MCTEPIPSGTSMTLPAWLVARRPARFATPAWRPKRRPTPDTGPARQRRHAPSEDGDAQRQAAGFSVRRGGGRPGAAPRPPPEQAHNPHAREFGYDGEHSRATTLGPPHEVPPFGNR